MQYTNKQIYEMVKPTRLEQPKSWFWNNKKWLWILGVILVIVLGIYSKHGTLQEYIKPINESIKSITPTLVFPLENTTINPKLLLHN